MKVIQVTAFFHPSVGGVERQAEEIATHLKDKGIDVVVYTTDATHGKEKRMQRLDDNFRGVKVRRFHYLLPFGDFFRFSPSLIWALLRADYDIIHLHNSHDAHLLPAVLVKIIRRKKLVLTGHNPYVVGSQKRGDRLHFGVSFFEFVLRFFAPGIDTYIALLESEKDAVHERLGIRLENIVVVPNGIEDLFYTSDGEPEKFYSDWEIDPGKWDLIVGTACRINYVKGLQFLELAAKKLKRVLFVFVGGDDGYYENLKRIYRDNKNVEFTVRYLPSSEVRNFYQAIDIFLLPSVYEPFGMTIVEAMAEGKMVLASNVGGPNEIVDPAFGELLQPDDQELWYQRIKYYAENKGEVMKKGEKAKSFANRYQWSVIISQIIGVYEKLID